MNDEDRFWDIFSSIFVEMLVKKLASIRKMVSMDVGPSILENIDVDIVTYDKRLIDVFLFMFWLFFESRFIVSNEYALFFDFSFKRRDREEMALLNIFAIVTR